HRGHCAQHHRRPPQPVSADVALDVAGVSAGINSIGKTAAKAHAATAAHSAAFNDHAMSGPATAEPIGLPTELSDIETAKARPNHAVSVRRWRSVKRPMSNGPVARPRMMIAAPTTTRLGASGRMAVARVAMRMATTII